MAVFLSTGSMTAMHRGSSSQVSFFIQTETGKTIPQLSTASNYNIKKAVNLKGAQLESTVYLINSSDNRINSL